MMKTKLRKVLWVAAVVALVLCIGFGFSKWASAPTLPAPQAAQPQTVLLTIDGLYTDKSVEISSGETMLQVLQALNAQDPALQLETKEYAGMGTLVTGMHGVENGSSTKYWQYKVNGVEPQVGAGELQLKGGDSAEWFFGASQE